jgi:hypothetical protein
VIEGRGENGSAENLLQRLSIDLGHPEAVWKVGGRTTNLKSASALIQQCEKLRARGDCDRALLLQDDEDGCPRLDGPRLAGVVRGLDLPFPVAVVLFFREYETLFLPCLHTMAGRPLKDDRGIELAPLAADARFSGDPEAKRNAKRERSTASCRGRTLTRRPRTSSRSRGSSIWPRFERPGCPASARSNARPPLFSRAPAACIRRLICEQIGFGRAAQPFLRPVLDDIQTRIDALVAQARAARAAEPPAG